MLMYVCVCNAVTDCQIREAYCEGACSMRLLRQKLGVAGCCGRCAPCARDVLRECRQESERRAAMAEEQAQPLPVAATA
ncbi:(2Fe-2S)-binding protein [Salinisphaera hydrothermalis]|uniref:Bacterioferritin-associated ferredoxin n=2 Tax=Salinisphaera TaxID=180541 RepID=A0A084III9_SALHC|nr:bacterioferritin-associated ferredoxin [Salinisphaera hydrothermalis C41B8]